MFITRKTATAVALLLGAAAYPASGIGQTTTETDQVEVEVIEEGATEEGATEEAAEATEEQVEENAEAAEEQVEESAEAAEEQAEEVSDAAEEQAEQTGEAAEEQVEQAGEVAEEQAEQTEEIAEEQAEQTEEMAEEVEETPPPGMVIASQTEGEWLASDVLDREVVNRDGESIGDISDILLRSDGPEGVIIDVGGFLGLGEKQIAVKWDELAFSQEGILLDTTEDALKNAEEFVSLEEMQSEAERQAAQQNAEVGTTPAATETEPLPETEAVEEQPAEGTTEQSN